MIHNANTICVYGMLLGESDLCWRNMLRERARTEQEKELKKAIKQGEKWIEEKLQDTVLLT